MTVVVYLVFVLKRENVRVVGRKILLQMQNKILIGTLMLPPYICTIELTNHQVCFTFSMCDDLYFKMKKICERKCV